MPTSLDFVDPPCLVDNVNSMYVNLFLPYPIPSLSAEEVSKKSKKGKGKAVASEAVVQEGASSSKSCWAGLGPTETANVAASIALTGHRELE